MPDLRTLPVKFTPFTGDPNVVVPSFQDQILYKTDNVSGPQGIYRATGTNAGDVEAASSSSGILGTSENTPVGNVTPTDTNQLYIQNVTSASPYKKVFWISTGLTNTDWTAVGGTPILDSANIDPNTNITSDYIGQRYIRLSPTSSAFTYVSAFISYEAGVTTAWLEEI